MPDNPGLLFVGFGLGTLWAAFARTPDEGVALLVVGIVVGLLGVLLTRSRRRVLASEAHP